MHFFERRALRLAEDLLPSPSSELHFESGPVPGSLQAQAVSLFSLRLCALTSEEGFASLDGLFKRSPLVLVIDWPLPERNLELPAAWLSRLWLFGLASIRQGKNGRDIYRKYIKNGALQGFLYLNRTRFQVLRYSSMYRGALAAAVLNAV